jgi:glycosyltransferase involved in cell wall biosynthesis
VTFQSPKISVAIPVFNEANVIENSLNEVIGVLEAEYQPGFFEILVIDDGSTDKTSKIVEELDTYGHQVRLIRHITNLGRGAAVRTAMANFFGEILIVLDADLSYSPKVIGDLLKPILTGSADLTLASPYSPGGSVRNVPIIRALISRLGNLILKNTFKSPRPTSTSIVRGYSSNLIQKLNLISQGKELNLEVLYKTELLQFRIVDVPAILSWPDHRRKRAKNKGTKNYLSLAPIIRSHLLFQFFTRPGIVFGFPIIASFATFLFGVFLLFSSFWTRILNSEQNPIRQTLIDGLLTLTVTGFSFVTGLLFTVIFFLVVQGKLYFEEMYVLLSQNLVKSKRK